MAIRISDECINCSSCEAACPNNAIYPGGAEWRIADGTSVRTSFATISNGVIDAFDPQPPLATDVYYIVPDKCTECVGFHDTPQCASVCPIDCCIDDSNHPETEDALREKKINLHL